MPQLDHVARLSAAAARPQQLDLAQRRVGFRHRLRGAMARTAGGRVDAAIRVPFAPETRASGIGDTGFPRDAGTAATLRRRRAGDERSCSCTSAPSTTRPTVWVNGTLVRRARGRLHAVLRRRHGARRGRPTCELVVRADDDPADLAKPRGKQDWQLEPHSIWYPRTTGIWQTVWLERVPATRDRRSSRGRRTSSAGRSASKRRVRRRRDATGLRLARAAARAADACWPTTSTRVIGGEVHRRIALSDPGHRRLPQRAALEPGAPHADRRGARALRRPAASVIDRVESYTALRSIAVAGRPLRAQRPARTRCGWCSIRATGPRPG